MLIKAARKRALRPPDWVIHNFLGVVNHGSTVRPSLKGDGLHAAATRWNAVSAYLAILRGRATEAEVRLRRAWDIVNPERDPGTAALIAQRYVLHSLIRCRGDELVGWADRALELADRDSPAGIESAAIRGLGMLAAGHPKRAAAAYDDLAGRVRHGAQAQRITMGRGWVQFIRDDVDAARSSLESAVAAAGLGGSTRITLWSLAWLARVQFAVGDWDRALAGVGAARELVSSSGIVIVTPMLEWTAAQIHALRGDWADAEAAVRAADVGHPGLRNDADPNHSRAGTDRRGGGRLCQGAAAVGAVHPDGQGHLTVRTRLLAVAGRAGQRVGDRRPAGRGGCVPAPTRGTRPGPRAPFRDGAARICPRSAARRTGRSGRRASQVRGVTRSDSTGCRCATTWPGSISPTARRCGGRANAGTPTW